MPRLRYRTAVLRRTRVRDGSRDTRFEHLAPGARCPRRGLSVLEPRRFFGCPHAGLHVRRGPSCDHIKPRSVAGRDRRAKRSGHLHRLVAAQRGDGAPGGAAHHQPRRERVPQVVPRDVLNPGELEGAWQPFLMGPGTKRTTRQTVAVSARAVEGSRSLFSVGKWVANPDASQPLTVVQIFRPQHVTS